MARSRRNRRKSAKPVLPKLPKLPSVPRPVINWHALFGLFAFAAILIVGAALGRELLDLPVRQLELEGQLERVTRLEVLAAAKIEAGTGFLTADLDEIRERVGAIDWIDEVTLQRIWPDTLRITFSEHRAAARWAGSRKMFLDESARPSASRTIGAPTTTVGNDRSSTIRRTVTSC